MVHPIPSGATVTAVFGQRGRYWSMDQANDPLRALRRGNNGRPGYGIHTGYDLYAREGTPIVAATPGEVVANASDSSYGNRVVIRFDGEDWWYCHLRERSPLDIGQRIEAGEGVGRVGQTGNVSGPHLHLERRIAGGGWVRSHLRDPKVGLAWKPPKIAHRIGTWNVALIIKRPNLADRVKRIRAKVKHVRLDVLGVQEAPSSGDGRHLKATLIGRDGKRMKRVGAKARYIFLRSDAKVHGSATWNPWPKNKKVTKPVTTACATIDGHKRFYVNCHPVSGAGFSKHRELHAKATIVKSIRRAKKHGLGREDVVFMGDFNGPEFATVAARYGFVRVRKHAKTVGSIVRTYQAFGKKKRTDAGGQYDYILVHESKAKAVTRARTFWTWKASDHNLTIAEIKEV